VGEPNERGRGWGGGGGSGRGITKTTGGKKLIGKGGLFNWWALSSISEEISKGKVISKKDRKPGAMRNREKNPYALPSKEKKKRKKGERRWRRQWAQKEKFRTLRTYVSGGKGPKSNKVREPNRGPFRVYNS